MLQAASEIGADSIVMDCEDGVAVNMKDVARQTIALMLDGEHKQPVVPSMYHCLPKRLR
jgi:citrate lyase beta subunit